MKAIYSECCSELLGDLVVFQDRKTKYSDAILYCKHCGKLWKEEVISGIYDPEYRIVSYPGRIKHKHKE